MYVHMILYLLSYDLTINMPLSSTDHWLINNDNIGNIEGLPECIDGLPVEGCVVADCGTLAVCSSLLGPLLVALIGLSVPLGGALFASATRSTPVPGIPRNVTGLGLGENNECAVEYAWTDLRSIGDTHISSSGTRPRDSTKPGVLWHLPMATGNCHTPHCNCVPCLWLVICS